MKNYLHERTCHRTIDDTFQDYACLRSVSVESILLLKAEILGDTLSYKKLGPLSRSKTSLIKKRYFLFYFLATR